MLFQLPNGNWVNPDAVAAITLHDREDPYTRKARAAVISLRSGGNPLLLGLPAGTVSECLEEIARMVMEIYRRAGQENGGYPVAEAIEHAR